MVDVAFNGQQYVDEYKKKVKADAEQLVSEVFPVKIKELNDLLESKYFDYAMLPTLQSDKSDVVNHVFDDGLSGNSATSKKRKLEDGTTLVNHATGDSRDVDCPSNIKIVELVELVKPQIRSLIDHGNLIKMWITYLIPRIEDGNNFGVSIQEDALQEARQIETDAATYLEQISRYFMTRGKVMSKWLRYPGIGDYRATARELDEKEFVNLRLVLCELRNHYCSLHDLIMKNLEKIKKPRNANSANMY